jgi:hypothetical protein
MAANDTTNALKHPHPGIPFSHVGDDIITALTQLAEIFKNNFQKPKSPELTHYYYLTFTLIALTHE